MKKIFRWTYLEMFTAIIGLFLYCLSIEIFIVPNHLYNGGIMGVSQLIKTVLTTIFNLKFSFDITSIIYYIINIPLFYLAYKKVGKTFFYRTVFCVSISTIFLLLIPSLDKPLMDDILTNILVGGAICGFGCGLALSVGASSGGTDIIGMVLTQKYRFITVGNFNLTVNAIVYGISAIVGGIETMIYSILYSVFDSFVVDRMHLQNINSTVLIFTKKNPKIINNYIKEKLDRDFTYWEAKGGYDDSRTYITYAVLSKYEKNLLENAMKENKIEAFTIASDHVSVLGDFKKKL